MESSYQGVSEYQTLSALHTTFPKDPLEEYIEQAKYVLGILDLPELLEKELTEVEKLYNCSESLQNLKAKINATIFPNDEVERELPKSKEIDLKLGAIFNNIRQSKLKNEQNCLKHQKRKSRTQQNIKELMKKKILNKISIGSSSSNSEDEDFSENKVKKLKTLKENNIEMEESRDPSEDKKTRRRRIKTKRKSISGENNKEHIEKSKEKQSENKYLNENDTVIKETVQQKENLPEINLPEGLGSVDNSQSFLKNILYNKEGVYKTVFDVTKAPSIIDKSCKVRSSTLEKLRQFRHSEKISGEINNSETNVNKCEKESGSLNMFAVLSNSCNPSSQSSHSQSIFSIHGNSSDELEDLEL